MSAGAVAAMGPALSSPSRRMVDARAMGRAVAGPVVGTAGTLVAAVVAGVFTTLLLLVVLAGAPAESVPRTVVGATPAAAPVVVAPVHRLLQPAVPDAPLR